MRANAKFTKRKGRGSIRLYFDGSSCFNGHAVTRSGEYAYIRNDETVVSAVLAAPGEPRINDAARRMFANARRHARIQSIRIKLSGNESVRSIERFADIRESRFSFRPIRRNTGKSHFPPVSRNGRTAPHFRHSEMEHIAMQLINEINRVDSIDSCVRRGITRHDTKKLIGILINQRNVRSK